MCNVYKHYHRVLLPEHVHIYALYIHCIKCCVCAVHVCIEFDKFVMLYMHVHVHLHCTLLKRHCCISNGMSHTMYMLMGVSSPHVGSAGICSRACVANQL